jgi:hypothetical protein
VASFLLLPIVLDILHNYTIRSDGLGYAKGIVGQLRVSASSFRASIALSVLLDVNLSSIVILSIVLVYVSLCSQEDLSIAYSVSFCSFELTRGKAIISVDLCIFKM